MPITSIYTPTSAPSLGYATAYNYPLTESYFCDHYFSGVEITTLPTKGTLTDNGVSVTLNQIVPFSDIHAGNLIYTANTAGTDSLQFQVQESAGISGIVANVSLTNGGSGYLAGTTYSVTGGLGSGFAVNVIAVEGAITSVNSTPVNGGVNYQLGDILNITGDGTVSLPYGSNWPENGTVTVTGVSNGIVTSVSLTNAGSYYTTGTYTTQGKNGTGCMISLTVTTGSVFGLIGKTGCTFLSIVPTNSGINYAVNDVLTLSGGGNNCKLTVSSINTSNAAIQTLTINNNTPTTYYVSPTGNDANSGTLVSPFQGPYYAYAVSRPGDTINFLSGVYAPGYNGANNWYRMDSGGLPGFPITFQNYQGTADVTCIGSGTTGAVVTG